MKRKAAVALLAGSVVLLLAAGPAPAQDLLDANCPGPPNTSVDPDPGDRDVQTFTAQRTGSLVRGETEHIWLFMVPLVVAAAAPVAAGRVRSVTAAGALELRGGRTAMSLGDGEGAVTEVSSRYMHVFQSCGRGW